MLVSVVIPTYNGEKYLAQTLCSVQAQTFTLWELIVVDDGSSDGSSALVQTFAQKDRRIRLVQQANGGIARARNRGVEEADGASQYIAFLDHDDLWEPDALATLVALANAASACVGAHGLLRVIDANDGPLDPPEMQVYRGGRKGLVGKRVVEWSADRPTTFAVEACQHTIYTVGQALIRKAAFEAIGGFDPLTVPCDDWDFWLRLTLTGDLAFTPQTIVAWRHHASNTSNHKEKMLAAEELVRRKILALSSLDDQQRIFAWDCLRGASLRRLYEHRLQWARECLQGGRIVPAAKQLRQAGIDYQEYRRHRRQAEQAS